MKVIPIIMFEVEVIKSQQTKSVSSISGLKQVTDSAQTTSMNQCSESWMQMHHCIQIEENQNKKRIEMYLKHHLFKKVKFISSQKQMMFSNKKSSISYQICNNLNIKTAEQQLFWSV